MKFKVGDRIRIINTRDYEIEVKIGRIKEINETKQLYWIYFDDIDKYYWFEEKDIDYLRYNLTGKAKIIKYDTGVYKTTIRGNETNRETNEKEAIFMKIHVGFKKE